MNLVEYTWRGLVKIAGAARIARSKFYSFFFAEFGHGSRIESPIKLENPGQIAIGKNVHIGPGCWFLASSEKTSTSNPCQPTLEIGDECSFSGYCVISAKGKVVLENGVLVARNVYIADHSHEFINTEGSIRFSGTTETKETRVGKNTWIGTGVYIAPGVTIGERCVIGSNSVVTKSVPAFSVAVGIPAKIVKTYR